MHNPIDKSVEEIFLQSMKNAFIGKEEVVEEHVPTLAEEIAAKIANDRAIKEAAKVELEKELAEKVLHKSEDATTSAEKEKEIVEKNVKNKIEINPDMKESIVGRIYASYNNKYLSEKEYTVTKADKKGNTPAWQGYKAGKKNVKTGKPLYKAADHLKEDEKYGYDKDGNSLNPKDKKAKKKA